MSWPSDVISRSGATSLSWVRGDKLGKWYFSFSRELCQEVSLTIWGESKQKVFNSAGGKVKA